MPTQKLTNNNKLLELLGIDKWEIEAWITRLGSMPIKVIDRCDSSEYYSTTKFTILKLEDGNYATVEENGCSCYTAEDAEIEVFPTKEKAVAQFEKWIRLRNEYGLSCACGKHNRRLSCDLKKL